MRACAVLFLLLPAMAVADTARIATLNLGGFHKIPQKKLDNIIEGIKKLDADINVLPELNLLSLGQALADALNVQVDGCYKSVVPDQPKARQEIGIIHKCGVSVTNPGIFICSDFGKRDYRNAAVAYEKIDEFDFTLVGLHLKAGRGSSNRHFRDQQLTIINAYIQGALITVEKNALVIGDYNMIPGPDADNFNTMNADNSLRYISSEDLSGQGSHISTSGIGNLLDGYAFTNVDAPEYQEISLEILPMHDALGFTLSDYKARVTDHVPQMVEFW